MVAGLVRKEVSFNGFVMNAGNFVVDSVTHSMPQRQITSFQRLIKPGSIASKRNFSDNTVEINGRIVSKNRLGGANINLQGLELLLDRFKKNIIPENPAILLPGFQDERFYVNAELTDKLEINWNENDWAEIFWLARFYCPDPMLYSATASQLLDTSALGLVTSGEYSKTVVITPGGTTAAWPRYRVDVPVLGPYGITALWLVNTSLTDSPTLKIVKTLAASDLVIIDAAEMSVTINGVEVDYSGSFPAIDPRPGATNTLELHVLATSTPTLNCQFNWRSRYF